MRIAGFFGKPLDYQPLPQQTGPPRQARQRLLGLSSINSRGEESNLSPLWHSHFRSSVTATGQTPLPTPALWVSGSMKRIANSSPNRRNKKDEHMGTNT